MNLRSVVALLFALGVLLAGDSPALAATVDVTTYGASPAASGSANRTAFSAAIAAATSGDTLYVPNGTYLFDVSALHSILINKPLTLLCQSQSAVLKFDPAVTGGAGSTARLVEVTASNVTLSGCTFDGNKPTSPGTLTPYDSNVEHHLGIFAGPTISSFTIRGSLVQNFEGDGLQIYTGVASPLVEDNFFQWNQRSGMSFTPTSSASPVTNAIVRRNTFRGIGGQPLDNEHGPVIGAEIYSNTFTSPDTNNYAITVSGYTDGIGSANRSKNWWIHDNALSTAIFVIRAEDVLIENNTTQSVYTKACVDIWRSAARITVKNNVCTMTQVGTTSVPAYQTIGTTEQPACTSDADCDATAGATCDTVTTHQCTPVYAYPEDITFGPGNVVNVYYEKSFAVRSESTKSVTVTGNTFINNAGAVAAGFAAVYLRATIAGRDFELATVTDNVIRDFGQAGVYVAGNGAAVMRKVVATGNRFYNASAAKPMTRGVQLDDGTHALQEAVVRGNIDGCGVTSPIFNLTAGIRFSSWPFRLSASC